MNIGDRVYKKSRKPFQHGKRVGVIKEFTELYIKAKGESVPAVILHDCVGPVAQVILRSDAFGLIEVAKRDEPKYVVYINCRKVARVETPKEVWELIGKRTFGSLYEVKHEDTTIDTTEFIPF